MSTAPEKPEPPKIVTIKEGCTHATTTGSPCCNGQDCKCLATAADSFFEVVSLLAILAAFGTWLVFLPVVGILYLGGWLS